jgi:hypothetical protein
VDSCLTPEAELGGKELSGLLQREISHELPMPVVAEKPGISVAAAKSRLLHARLELRQRLEKHCAPTATQRLPPEPSATI